MVNRQREVALSLEDVVIANAAMSDECLAETSVLGSIGFAIQKALLRAQRFRGNLNFICI